MGAEIYSAVRKVVVCRHLGMSRVARRSQSRGARKKPHWTFFVHINPDLKRLVSLTRCVNPGSYWRLLCRSSAVRVKRAAIGLISSPVSSPHHYIFKTARPSPLLSSAQVQQRYRLHLEMSFRNMASRTRLAAGICLAFASLAHSHGPPWWTGGNGGGGGYPGSGGGSGNWNGWGGWGGGGGDGDGDGDGGRGGGSNGENGGFPGAGFLSFDIEKASYYRGVHGIVCSLAMVVLFPLGSIFMRIIPGRFALWIHGLFQMLALCVYIAGVGVGIYLVTYVTIPFGGGNLLTNDATKYHPIIGLVVFVVLLVQPIFGVVHHARFNRVQRRQVWSYLHLFNGRVAITLGIINGGLGLYLADASADRKKVYTIVAAVMWTLWMLVALWAELMRYRRNRKAVDAGVLPTSQPAMVGAKNMQARRSDSERSGRSSSARSDRSARRSRSGRRSTDLPPRI